MPSSKRPTVRSRKPGGSEMTDRVYPTAKPNPLPPPPSAASGVQPSFPATKGELYNRLPVNRPHPSPKHRRGCCCSFCCWLFLILLALVLLAAIAGSIFYVIYRPHRPEFSVSSLRFTALNVTASNQITSRLDIAVTSRNPNRKIVFLYDSISISVSSNGAGVGDGSFPAFAHEKKNTTVMKATLSNLGHSVDPSAAADLKKSRISLEIHMETKAGVKIGKLKTKKVRIKIYCEGIEVAAPKGKKAPPPSTPDGRCKLKLRMKIWKWTL